MKREKKDKVNKKESKADTRTKENQTMMYRHFKEIRFGLVSFFNGISSFVGYLMPKPSFLKNRSGTIWEDKGVHTFLKGICPKVNVIAQLEFELSNYNSVVPSLLQLHLQDTPKEINIIWDVYGVSEKFISFRNLITSPLFKWSQILTEPVETTHDSFSGKGIFILEKKNT